MEARSEKLSMLTKILSGNMISETWIDQTIIKNKKTIISGLEDRGMVLKEELWLTLSLNTMIV